MYIGYIFIKKTIYLLCMLLQDCLGQLVTTTCVFKPFGVHANLFGNHDFTKEDFDHIEHII